MSALSELLDGAIREDAVRLDGAGFATDRFGAVRGRIARRRVARSAGVGGASVLGIGVLAVGGSQLAANGLGFGGPGSPATVVCTTTEPFAATGLAVMVPDNAIFAVTDKASGEVFFVGASYVDTADAGTGTPLAWQVDGAVVEMSGSDPHIGTLTLPSGASVELNTLTGGVTPSDSTAVTIMPVKDFAQQIGLGSLYDVEVGAVPGSGSAWDLKLNGGSIGTFTSDGFTTTFTFENGESEMFDLAESGIVAVTLPGGENLVFRRADGQPVYVGEATAAAVANLGPKVTCSTASPQPSASASAHVSPSPSATPTLGQASGKDSSPFECGYVFDRPTHNSDGIAVTTTRWLSATEAIAELQDEYGSNVPSSVPTPTSGTLAVGVDVSVTAPDGRDIQDAGGGGDFIDPAGYLEKHSLPGRAFMAGTTIVGVNDGKVVATVPADRDPSLLLYSNIAPDADLALTVIDADAALAPCGDATTWTDIYVVTGIGLISGNEWLVDPVYAWTAVPPQP